FKDPNFTTAHREALYHLLADKFFKLGDYVPRTTVFKHPFTEQAHSAMEYVKGAKKYRTPSQLEAIKNPEDLHKLAIMDFILGNNDRHQGNIIFTKDGDIRLIDHGMTFDYGKAFSAEIPVYATRLYDDEVQVPKN